jgi:hypothetical protein
VSIEPGQLQLQALPLEELAHQLSGSGLVPSGVDQHFEHFALRIDGPPQVHLLATDLDEHLVQMPASMRFRPSRPKPSCDDRAEGEDPASNGLVGDRDPALGHHLLDVAKAGDDGG